MIEQWSADDARIERVLAAALHQETAAAMLEAECKARPGGNIHIADALLSGNLAVHSSRLIIHVELWAADSMSLDQVLACAESPILALAAYAAELVRGPGRKLKVRQRTWVLMESHPSICGEDGQQLQPGAFSRARPRS